MRHPYNEHVDSVGVGHAQPLPNGCKKLYAKREDFCGGEII